MHARSLTQSCLNLCNPMDCSPPGSSAHVICQTRILEWVAISFSKESSQPRDQTGVSCISCIGRWILYLWASWEVWWLSFDHFIIKKFSIIHSKTSTIAISVAGSTLSYSDSYVSLFLFWSRSYKDKIIFCRWKSFEWFRRKYIQPSLINIWCYYKPGTLQDKETTNLIILPQASLQCKQAEKRIFFISRKAPQRAGLPSGVWNGAEAVAVERKGRCLVDKEGQAGGGLGGMRSSWEFGVICVKCEERLLGATTKGVGKRQEHQRIPERLQWG